MALALSNKGHPSYCNGVVITAVYEELILVKVNFGRYASLKLVEQEKLLRLLRPVFLAFG